MKTKLTDLPVEALRQIVAGADNACNQAAADVEAYEADPALHEKLERGLLYAALGARAALKYRLTKETP
jgi:hypothetical protein